MSEGGETARYMSAREAAAELGVKLPTLYAYVSRGLVRSEEVGKGRGRRYRAEDVRRLRERVRGRRDPGRVAEGALSWGMPVMESGICLIADGRLYYRGWEAVALASGGASIEEVAALIWAGEMAQARALFGEGDGPARPPDGLSGLAPFEGFGALLPLAASRDPGAYDLRPRSVARTGARILRLMAGSAAGRAEGQGSIAGALGRGWVPREPGAAELLGAAMILCADHELNVSAFTARCVASSGATPYAVVSAGLAALSGTRHGGQVELVEALLDEAGRVGARSAIASRLKRGEKIAGFGHSLYPEGDPRGAELLRLTAGAYPRAEAVALAGTVAEVALDLLGERPTVDFGLAALARALGLPPGGALALFALGRSVGWIGHAIEQYEEGSLIRPRARYVGEPPLDDS